MTILNNLLPIFVPLVGLVFPAVTMASLSLHVQKKQDFLDPIRSDRGRFHLFIYFFKT